MRKFLAIYTFVLFLFGCSIPAIQPVQPQPEEDSFDAPTRAQSNVLRVKAALEKKHPSVDVENWYGFADDD